MGERKEAYLPNLKDLHSHRTDSREEAGEAAGRRQEAGGEIHTSTREKHSSIKGGKKMNDRKN